MEKKYVNVDSSKARHELSQLYESADHPETKEHLYDAIIKNKVENDRNSYLVPENHKENKEKIRPKFSKKLILFVVLTLVSFFSFLLVLILASRNHGFLFSNPSSGPETSGSEIPDEFPDQTNGEGFKNTVVLFPRQHFRSVIEIMTATNRDPFSDDRIPRDGTSQFLKFSIQRRIYNTHLLTRRNQIERKGIDVISTNESLVVGFSSFPGCCSTDAYNGISVENLGKDYIGVTLSASRREILNWRKYLAVVAVYNDTRISFRVNATSGKTWTNITLNKLETYQLSRASDLTGSRVTGDKPFAFFSGDECAFFHGGCSLTIEHLPKISDLGKTYIIPPFLNASRVFYRIVPTTPMTKVVIKNLTETLTSLMITDNYIQNHVTSLSSVTYIETSEPILVSVYIAFNNQFVSMAIVPPVCQFSNDFVLVTPSFKAFENYCVVIIEAKHAMGLYLDKSKLNEIVLMHYSTILMEDGKRWQTMSFLLPDGVSNIHHPNKVVRFGIIQYGVDLHSKRDIYAFPSSFRFDSESCN